MTVAIQTLQGSIRNHSLLNTTEENPYKTCKLVEDYYRKNCLDMTLTHVEMIGDLAIPSQLSNLFLSKPAL
eukprot:3063167-Amphidinium_carterae.1